MTLSVLQRRFGTSPTGADPGGGGGLGDRTPPPFWGTPKLHKEVKKYVMRVCAKTPHFRT